MAKQRTHDGQFFTTEKIGQTRELTPEGFLLCRGVPIARTGELLYGEGEVPVEPGRDGIVHITRGPEVLFDPQAIASFEGKDIVDDHPDDDVTPENWKDLSLGSVHNVCRGEGEFIDCLVADLLVKDAEAIKLIDEGKVEISCGYDAEYTQDAPGIGRQTQIIGNHVALVDSGRCGSRCSIGDAAMAKVKGKVRFRDRIMGYFKARDAEGMAQVLDEMEEEEGADTHVHVHLPSGANGQAQEETQDEGEQDTPARDPLLVRLEALLPKLEKLIPQEEQEGHQLDQQTCDEDEEGQTEDEKEDDDERTDDSEEKEKTKDSDFLARIEVLNPGQKVGKTTDAKKAGATRDAAKRRALGAALEKHGKLVKPFLMGQTTDKLSGATLDAAFIGASELIKQHNNTKAVIASVHTKDAARPQGMSVGDLNAKNRDFWSGGNK